MIEIKKNSNETEEQFLWRIGQLIDSGKIQNWKSINDIVNKELGIEEEKWRDESAFRKRYQAAKNFYNNCFSKMKEDDYQKELKAIQKNIEKERVKLRTEKLEYNKWLREEARDEMIKDEIISSISNLKPLSIPRYIKPKMNKKAYLLAISDCHYGIEFEIKDLFGNIINEYSPEIFEVRMWHLLNQVIDFINKEKVDTLYLWDLGDGIESILRLNSQLMKLRYGIIDASIRYANFLAEWINVLSKYVRVNFQMVMSSNHCELRICNAPKGAFPEENMSKVMMTLIKEKLKNNPNVNIVENPTGLNYSQLTIWNCVGLHNESKNFEQAVNDLSKFYGVQVDYAISGHFHSYSGKETGICSEVLNVRSIMGTNPYAETLRKPADAGASLFVFDQVYGKVADISFKLN